MTQLSQQELEMHIEHCGQLMTSAYACYEASSCFGDLGEAHHWRIAMERAIGLRAPSVVSAMETTRGLN